jgi:beta-galactosidase
MPMGTETNVPALTDVGAFLHGGDYNPCQWPEELWPEDVRLMKAAGCNAVSLGIFAWARLEPREGEYDFGWMDRAMDLLAENEIHVCLATPTAAHPRWLTQKHPDVQRMRENGVRGLHEGRVNYCPTSPVLREKYAQIVRKLAERYKDHPALILWHIHNEYGGMCFCERCAAGFREYLKRKFGTLERLNEAYWTMFWSQTYTDWEEIHPYGQVLQGLQLDWRRYASETILGICKLEADILREVSPGVPVTTNTFEYWVDYQGERWAEEMDVVALDAYPQYHARPEDVPTGAEHAFRADYYRCLKQKPFLLMETTPSSTNWMKIAKLKRPGVHRLTALQHVAHGAESVQYFQWRASRGGAEKFHGAVVTHNNREDARVFQEVAEVGGMLERSADLLGSMPPVEAAFIYDKENDWALELSAKPMGAPRQYQQTLYRHHRAFWEAGVPIDVVYAEADLSRYKLVVAPMLYMLRPGVGEALSAYVRGGGTLVTSYWTGYADENDLVFSGGAPGPLAEVLGIRSEEVDFLHEDEHVDVAIAADEEDGLEGIYRARDFCELIHADTAEVLATYDGEFYKGRPALTCNTFGSGRAYYQAFRAADQAFLAAFYRRVREAAGVAPALPIKLPQGVTCQVRKKGGRTFAFLLNFAPEPRKVKLKNVALREFYSGEDLGKSVKLPPHDGMLCERMDK